MLPVTANWTYPDVAAVDHQGDGEVENMTGLTTEI